jgi:hypothetical protein
MNTEPLRETALRIVVLFPGNSLMHQMSSWSGAHPDGQLRFRFPGSLSELRTILRPASVSVIDATERPLDAMLAFGEALGVLGAERVVVYSETIHQGLELHVRTHGALLLSAPMNDAKWQELLETKGAAKTVQASLATSGVAPAWAEGSAVTARPPRRRLDHLPNNRFPKSA